MRCFKIYILVFATLLVACGLGETDLDNLKKETMTFDNLPDTVRTIYKADANTRKTEFSDIVLSTDNDYTISLEHSGMDDGFWTLMTRGFKHHFYINEKHFSLQANQGDPFILHNSELYYTTELNLADYNYFGG